VTVAGSSFTERRQQRLRAYIKGLAPRSPAGIAIGPDVAETPTGQAAVLTAANLLSRSHPSVVATVPDVPLLVASPLGGRDLQDACHRIVTGVDPMSTFDVVATIPAEITSMGLGVRCGTATVYCGGRRWTGIVADSPVETTGDPSSLLGLGLAVTEAAAVLFRRTLTLPARWETRLSLWTLADVDGDAATGPADAGPIDVGRTWLVGAGAVGSCLAWWLHLLGVFGEWTVIDGDVVKDLNLDRSLVFFAEHTGEFSAKPQPKAAVVSALIPGSTPETGWWSDWVGTDPASPDVIVLAANERGVRPAVAAYSHPAVIAATTSHNWTAELHRHLILRDGCVTCRFPETAPVFGCATGTVEESVRDARAEPRAKGDGSSKDASLPFLSGAAGLLAATGLLHLQHGRWAEHKHNQWAFGFDATAPALASRIWPHWASCGWITDSAARRVIHGSTRWAGLDSELGR